MASLIDAICAFGLARTGAEELTEEADRTEYSDTRQDQHAEGRVIHGKAL
jgi:hypothetical protein